MATTLIENALVVNENSQFKGYIFIKDEWIEEIGEGIAPAHIQALANDKIDAEGMLLLPGLIDDQVHFREPGLTHKGDLFTESRAAVAGGITSFMEMPNTVPGAVTGALLEEKYQRASEVSLANYSFFMGTTNDNAEEILKQDYTRICGIKIFLGSSTGNMLVDDFDAIKTIFKYAKVPVLTHCEDDNLIALNLQKVKAIYGDQIPCNMHPVIRDEEACYRSSSATVELAHKYGTQLHVLHISTERELSLFEKGNDIGLKKITAEACLHHCWFTDADYESKQNFIKWNPAVKKQSDRDEIRKAIMDGRIDILATDHAPHTLEEKMKPYQQAPSGGPLVQHALLAWLELVDQGVLSLETLVKKAAHNPAILFKVNKRGFLRKGYYADLVLVKLNQAYEVTKQNILYKCGWSPFEAYRFKHSINQTWVNGKCVYANGRIIDESRGMRLTFDR
jgi:dihydroorotase